MPMCTGAVWLGRDRVTTVSDRQTTAQSELRRIGRLDFIESVEEVAVRPETEPRNREHAKWGVA